MYKTLKRFNVGLLNNLISGIKCKDSDINQKHLDEATFQGLELVCRSTDSNKNLYKHKCGHFDFLQPTHVRRSSFKCSTCHFIQQVNDAARNNIQFLFKTRDTYRKYMMPCGHVFETTTSSMRYSTFESCKYCFNENLEHQIDKLGIDYIEAKPRGYHLFKFKSCGHVRTAHQSQFFLENIVCQECKEIEYIRQAVAEGLVYNGPCLDKTDNSCRMKRNYTLPCGHIRDLRLSHVRESNWCCDICSDSHLVKPSYVYLIELDSNGYKFVKLGYAKNIKTRIQGYALKDTTAKIVYSIKFNTGKEAMLFENNLHKKYVEYNLDKFEMSKYLSSGNTECYPIGMSNTFLKELELIEKDVND